VKQLSDLHLKFAVRPHHVWKYGRHPICGGGEKKNKQQDENIMVSPIP